MSPDLQAALTGSDYDHLPDGIKASYSYREWLWLSDGQKATLVQRETEPDEDE